MAYGQTALGVATPNIDPVGAAQDARSQAINQQGAKISQAGELQDQDHKALDAVGALAFGVLNGNPDGTPDPERSKTAVQMLGPNNPLAAFVEKNPQAWNIIAKSVMEAKKSTDTTTWSNSTVPIKVTNADGSVSYQLGQVNDHGGGHVVDFGGGAAPIEPTTTVDLGTTRGIVSRGGDLKGNIPIDNEGKARDTAVGTAEGTGAVAAPGQIAVGDEMLQQIDAVLNDPDLGQAVGIGGLLPAIPNTHQAGIVASIEQLQGGAFLAAYNQLKGAGQISEVEGKKATDAIARLQRVQNIDDFKKALTDLRDVVSAARDRAEKMSKNRPGGDKTNASPAAAENAHADPSKMSDDEIKKALGL